MTIDNKSSINIKCDSKEDVLAWANSLNLRAPDCPTYADLSLSRSLGTLLDIRLFKGPLAMILGRFKDAVQAKYLKVELLARRNRKGALSNLPPKTVWSVEDILRGNLSLSDVTVVFRGSVVADAYICLIPNERWLSVFEDICSNHGVSIISRISDISDERKDAIQDDINNSKDISRITTSLKNIYEDIEPLEVRHSRWAMIKGIVLNYGHYAKGGAYLLPIDYGIPRELIDLGYFDVHCIGRYIGNKKFKSINISATKVYNQSVGDIYDFHPQHIPTIVSRDEVSLSGDPINDFVANI